MYTNIVLTENAASKILSIINDEPNPETSYLRIRVDGGGCSGFRYDYQIVTNTEPGDLILESNGRKILLIDDLSVNYMSGSVIDYIETLTACNFEIKNPNSTSKCGCGNSFSV